MKKSMLLMAVAGTCFLSSCSGEANPSIEDAAVIGKWNYETYQMTRNGQVEVAEQPYSGNVSGCSKDYLQFSADDVAVLGNYHGGTCIQDNTPGAWHITGESIVLDSGGEQHIYKVDDITDATLQVTEVIGMLGFTERHTYTFSKAD
jgi:hypothetical protein